jgi:transcriptional regulator with XRE-family HTH domain
MTDADLRKKLGAKLLVARIQEKNWNESEAAAAAKVAPKTIRRIERGGNYEISSVEKYAAALGKPVAEWLSEILTKETKRADASAGETFRPDTGDDKSRQTG